jgi:hypothetical protein
MGLIYSVVLLAISLKNDTPKTLSELNPLPLTRIILYN